MNIKDFKKEMLVTVKGNTYGHFATLELIPKTKGPQLVKVLHSSDSNFNFALIKQFKISDLKEIK